MSGHTLLVHPDVDGLDDHHVSGHHLLTWPAGEWDQLRESVEWALADPEGAREVRIGGHDSTRERHTYKVRCAAILDDLRKDGLL